VITNSFMHANCLFRIHQTEQIVVCVVFNALYVSTVVSLYRLPWRCCRPIHNVIGQPNVSLIILIRKSQYTIICFATMPFINILGISCAIPYDSNHIRYLNELCYVCTFYFRLLFKYLGNNILLKY